MFKKKIRTSTPANWSWWWNLELETLKKNKKNIFLEGQWWSNKDSHTQAQQRRGCTSHYGRRKMEEKWKVGLYINSPGNILAFSLTHESAHQMIGVQNEEARGTMFLSNYFFKIHLLCFEGLKVDHKELYIIRY